MPGRYKPYPKYKDSGVEWLGVIPEDWEISKVKFQALIKGRIGFRGYRVDDLVDENKGALVLGASEINSTGEIVMKSPKYISWAKYFESPEIMLKEGMVLMVQRGSVGKVAFVQKGLGPATINPSLIVFRDLKINPRYLTFSLMGSAVQNLVELENSSTAVPMISQEQVGNYFQPLPPNDEQRAIAAFLDHETGKLDELIAKQQDLIALLGEKRQAVISHAVTKGLNPNAPMKPSGIEWLGDIPEHWEVKKLKFISTCNNDVLMETTKPDFKFKYIDIGSVSAIDGIKNIVEYEFSKAPSRARRVVRGGDIIVSTVRTYLEAIAPIEDPSDNLIVSTGFAVIRPSLEYCHNFGAYNFRSRSFIEEVVARSTGISYPAINSTDLIDIQLALPPFDEQQQITKYLDKQTAKIDNLISKAKEAVELMQERRTALISAAVTGKIDVGDFEVEPNS